MKVIETQPWQKKLKSAQTFLKRWNGNTAKLWGFQVSHNVLTIRLEKKGVYGNLHISACGLEFIQGPVSWDNCNIDIRAETDEKGKRVRYLIRDERAGFEVRTETIEVAENCKPLYKPE